MSRRERRARVAAALEGRTAVDDAIAADVLAANADGSVKARPVTEERRREGAQQRLVTALEIGSTEEIEATAAYWELLVGKRGAS